MFNSERDWIESGCRGWDGKIVGSGCIVLTRYDYCEGVSLCSHSLRLFHGDLFCSACSLFLCV